MAELAGALRLDPDAPVALIAERDDAAILLHIGRPEP